MAAIDDEVPATVAQQTNYSRLSTAFQLALRGAEAEEVEANMMSWLDLILAAQSGDSQRRPWQRGSRASRGGRKRGDRR